MREREREREIERERDGGGHAHALKRKHAWSEEFKTERRKEAQTVPSRRVQKHTDNLP